MARIYTKKMHCIRGHEFTKENTLIKVYRDGNPRRICRACARLRANARYVPVENPRTNQNDGKTHCIKGHEFTPENTYMKGKHRICIMCRNSAAREVGRTAEAKYRALKKADPIRWEEERRRRRAEQLRRVGWTLELFDKAWSEQKGKCAICERDLNVEVKHNIGKAQADHEHIEPPKPREILCGNCNLGLGNFQDNPGLLRTAAAYVEKWKEG